MSSVSITGRACSPAWRSATWTRAWQLLAQRFLPGWRRLSAHTVPRVMLQLATLGDLANAQERAALADYVLRPPVKEFSMMDFERLDAIVRAGYEHTLKQVRELAADEAFVARLRSAGITLGATAAKPKHGGAPEAA